MPKLDKTVPYSLAKLRERYTCSHGVLMGWLLSSVGTDNDGNPCTVLAILERSGYKKKQSYLTPKQWAIITDHLDHLIK